MFNEGRYFEAHEIWEDLWRETHGPLKTVCQGLIHAAVGLYHIQRDNKVGARSQLRKALDKLKAHPASAPNLDVPDLISQIAGIVDALDQTAESGMALLQASEVRIRAM